MVCTVLHATFRALVHAIMNAIVRAMMCSMTRVMFCAVILVGKNAVVKSLFMGRAAYESCLEGVPGDWNTGEVLGDVMRQEAEVPTC